MSYFNTTNLTGSPLAVSREKAQSQQELILGLFRQHPKRNWTPDEVHRHLFGGNVPLTSVRRAITNLTSDGILEKTQYKRRGRFGKDAYAWKLKAVTLTLFSDE